MKNMKMIKAILGLLITFAVVLGLTLSVSAADDDSSNITAIDASEVTSINNTNSNTNSNSSSNTNNSNSNNSVNTVNNVTSTYNNTNLPSTGATSNTFLFLTVGALIVLAVVAYKKADYYKNI